MQACHLKVNHLQRALGINPGRVVLRWIPEGGLRQTAYRVVLQSGGAILHDSGKLESADRFYHPPVEIDSKTKVFWTVTLWDETGAPGQPASAEFETGLATNDWVAQWIDPELTRPPHSATANDGAPLNKASYLRKAFRVEDLDNARLYCTAHGVYDAYLNGVHVDGYFMAPGATNYAFRLQAQTYDVTRLLREGENEITVTLGDGWWRGSTGWSKKRCCYGDDLAFLCQLEVGGKPILCTDETWQASQDGALAENDTMRLERYDARKTATDWHPVRVERYGYENLIGSTVPLTAHERFPAKLLTTPNGKKVLDFGQNFAGYIELDVQAKGGELIRLTHGEVLDQNGNFQNDNFQNPKAPFCRQVLEYVCRPGRNQYHQTKCYYGFRYAKLETELPVTGAEFTGVAVYSDMEQTGFFSCGVPEVNRLFENAVWSMKSNFVDVPTDCPHREKLGFTGDLQVFSAAALYLMDSYPVMEKWMGDLAASQFADGNVPYVTPPRAGPRSVATFRDGSAGWSNAFEIVAERMLRFGNDPEDLRALYPGIKRWMLFNLERSKLGGSEKESIPAEYRDFVMTAGNHWGEWCEPGRTSADYTAEQERDGHAEEGTAFTGYGCLLTARIAEKLGHMEDAAFFRAAYERIKAAYRCVFTDGGAIRSERQCRYVRPVAHELLDGAERQAAVDALAELIRANGNKIGTGFLTTCHLCNVLTDYGHADTAYDLLLQTEAPSWLAEVLQGATTIWEEWFGFDEDGTPRHSHNHYAFGAVAAWLMGRVAGIVVADGKITLRPYPDRRLGHAEARYLSPLGRIESSWRYEGDAIRYAFTVPAGAEAEIILPDGRSQRVGAGEYTFCIRKTAAKGLLRGDFLRFYFRRRLIRSVV